jgi:Asp-tRNA(Asn)/Glu-tRNA(Gln) amidotransferase A subunit family amidase
MAERFGTYPLAASIMDNLAAGSMACDYTDDGLPLGLQIVAKSERQVLYFMKMLERSSGGFRPPAI